MPKPLNGTGVLPTLATINHPKAGAHLGKIDVCVASLQQLDKEFVKHLRSRIPIHCLLTSSKPGRGRARQDLLDRVDTEWFAFVDDDVRLRSDWWSQVSTGVSSGVGGVEGLWSYALADKRVDDYARAMAQMAKILGRRSWTERVDRAFTGDTLVRTEAVRGIRIPDINVYEDEYVRRYVERKGFVWLRTYSVVCDHLRRYNLKEAYDSGKYAFYFGQTTPLRQLRRLMQLPLRVLYSLYYTRNAGAGVFAIERDSRVLKGVLQGYVQRSGRSRIPWLDQ